MPAHWSTASLPLRPTSAGPKASRRFSWNRGLVTADPDRNPSPGSCQIQKKLNRPPSLIRGENWVHSPAVPAELLRFGTHDGSARTGDADICLSEYHTSRCQWVLYLCDHFLIRSAEAIE